MVEVSIHESDEVASVLTRAQAHKKVEEVDLADSILSSVLSQQESPPRVVP